MNGLQFLVSILDLLVWFLPLKLEHVLDFLLDSSGSSKTKCLELRSNLGLRERRICVMEIGV